MALSARATAPLLTTEARLMPLPGATGLLRASLTDITDRKHAETILAGERDVFARIAADAPLQEVLAATVALAEDESAATAWSASAASRPTASASPR